MTGVKSAISHTRRLKQTHLIPLRSLGEMLLLCRLFRLTNSKVHFDFDLAFENLRPPDIVPICSTWGPGEGKSKGRKNGRNRKDRPPILSILTDSRGGLQLTPLMLYTAPHSLSPSIYLFPTLPHWLTHICSRSIKLIKGSILSWSPLANTSANQ